MLCSAVAQAVMGTSQKFRRTYFELHDVINLNSVIHTICLDSVQFIINFHLENLLHLYAITKDEE